jgi:glutamate dehydrogenase
MSHAAAALKREQIGGLVEAIRERLAEPEAEAAAAFAAVYYGNAAPEDVVPHDVEALAGAALAHWRFAERRLAEEIKLRVYTPRLAADGWHARHTVIETVTDDMPFLLDSLIAALGQDGRIVHRVLHPIVAVARDGEGHRLSVGAGAGTSPESMIHIEIDEEADEPARQRLEAELRRVLEQVSWAVADWRAMLERLDEALADLAKGLPGIPQADSAEAADFLRWLREDHFTFLGYREYRREGDALVQVPERGLGLSRDPATHVMAAAGEGGPAVHHFVDLPQAIVVTKASQVSPVHRRVPLDFIGVRLLDAEGNVAGERRFVGLFTSTAYNTSVRDVPLIRAKVARIVARACFRPSSHDNKALVNILETYPRDELHQIAEDDLLDISLGILRLQERPRPRVFARNDAFGRFVSLLIFVPRDSYDSRIRRRIQATLEEAWHARVELRRTQLDESDLARLHMIVHLDPSATPHVDLDAVEARIAALARGWAEGLRDALVGAFGEDRGAKLWRRWAQAMPVAYRESVGPHAAVADIEALEALGPDGAVGQLAYRRLEDPDWIVRFKIYHRDAPVPLSACLPILEHFGFLVVEEQPFETTAPAETSGTPERAWIHDFRLDAPGRMPVDLAALKPRLEAAFARIWAGDAEDDGFNRLILGAGLDWREANVLRAYAKYLRQLATPYSQGTMEATLAAHPGIAADLVRLFEARFDPDLDGERAAREGDIAARLEQGLAKVASLDEDRILRRFLDLVRASLRTNHYQAGADGRPKPWLSIKLDARAVPQMPLPRPFVEIFVQSARVEAVHLRGGRVARGGIRWSDRRDDFRTEILGLMKAQMVKNAVIVPVGAKGGFVPKKPPTSQGREAVQADGIACYRIMMQGLLDLTDNIVGGKIVPPARTVRHDGDDPYLVVAADKGTATFSDIANAISADYGFWLGDAFASGGSAGYDHKAMGITARGAWEAVTRHFRELGRDIETAPFDVIGIGDMSGDVFGNGMLLSDRIRLIAAFDHRDVFLDPDPDPAASFAERKRLFAVPRSSWGDYDPGLISKGGGVYSRSLKAIPLSPEVKRLTGLDGDTATPADLIRALLASPCDLLWVGGIGTYVKAHGETNADVGDRANDALRVDGAQLKARVVGEGGNLGFTQAGRIEYALAGGRLNTDAIDNSAGVDCSDHEVNIKILLNALVADGELTGKQRNRLLAEMTGDVAALVLRDNYLQTQAISVAEARGATALDAQARLMRALERAGRLDRDLEQLPTDEEIAARGRARQGLTRPELAVLLAYSKTSLFEALLAGDAPEDPYFAGDLIRYFPPRLGERFPEAIGRHPLRREIVSTRLANEIVNWMGPTFVSRIEEATGFEPGAIARAYAATRDAFGLPALWDAIDVLDGKVEAAVQTDMLLATAELARRMAMWFLHNVGQPMALKDVMDAYAPGVAELKAALPDLLDPAARERWTRRRDGLVAGRVPEALAAEIAALAPLEAACDVVEAARGAGLSVLEAARMFLAIGDRLGLSWLRGAAQSIEPADHWERLALTALVDDLYAQQRALTSSALAHALGDLEGWLAANRPAIARAARVIDELKAGGPPTLAKLGFASRHIRGQLGP